MQPSEFDPDRQRCLPEHPNHLAINKAIEAEVKRMERACQWAEKLMADKSFVFVSQEVNQLLRDLYGLDRYEDAKKLAESKYDLRNRAGFQNILESTYAQYPIVDEKFAKVDLYLPEKYRSHVEKFVHGLMTQEIDALEEAKELESPGYSERNREFKQFKQAWDRYKTFCQNSLRHATYSRMDNNLKHLQRFAKKKDRLISFDLLGNEFGVEFTNFLIHEGKSGRVCAKGLTNTTVKSILKGIKSFLNWSFDQGLHKNESFRKWKFKTAQTDRKYLNEEQLGRLYQLELKPGSSLDVSRDLWLMMAFTGIRVGDLGKFHTFTIEDNVLRYSATKNGKRCMVALTPIPQAILEKYKGRLPKQAAQKINSNIKAICRLAGMVNPASRRNEKGGDVVFENKEFCELIDNHSARRSFINMMVRRKTPIMLLASMVGVSIKTLDIYYKEDPESILNFMSELNFDNMLNFSDN